MDDLKNVDDLTSQALIIPNPPNPTAPREPLANRLLISTLFVGAFLVAAWGLADLRLKPILLPSGVGLVVLLLALMGAARLVRDAGITKPFRELLGKIPFVGPHLYSMDESGRGVDGLLTCLLCLGVWVGGALDFVGLRVFTDESGFREIVLHGVIGTGGALFAHALTSYLEAHYREI